MEDITKDATVKAILANAAVKIIDAKPIGADALKIVDEEMLTR